MCFGYLRRKNEEWEVDDWNLFSGFQKWKCLLCGLITLAVVDEM